MKKVFLLFAITLSLTSIGLFGYLELVEGTNSSKHTWQVEGVMSDACQCIVFCPCEFMSRPTFGHCDDSAILHIKQGGWGDVKLNGLSVAVVSESPDGERLVDTVGHLKFARIYVPENTTDEQAEGLAEVARRIFGAFVTKATRISANEKVERVKMDVTVGPYRHSVKIPGILELDLETITGGDGKNPVVLANNAFTEAGFGDALIAKSKIYTYKNDEVDVDWNYGGRSASIRTFKMSGELGTN